MGATSESMLTVQNHRKYFSHLMIGLLSNTWMAIMYILNLIYRVYPDGDVVLTLLNMNNMTTSVMLRDTVLSSSSRDVYWLTPPGGTSDLQSRYDYFSVNHLLHDHVHVYTWVFH